jgi:hypothetical protein
VLAIAGILLDNASVFSYEYASFSTRGKTELSYNPDGSSNTSSSAMSREYITEYSYGVAESFNLIAPRLLGIK